MAEDLGGSYFGDRWSYNLARPPGWLASESAAVIRWYHDNVFDRTDIDPNDTLANIEAAFRREAARLGVRAPADSAGCLQWYGALQVGEASWAEIAGQTGSTATSGAGALSTNLLDTIAAQQTAAVTAARATATSYGGGVDSTDQTDAIILNARAADNVSLSNQISSGAPAYAPAPIPAREEAGILAPTQTGYTGYGGFNTQTSFAGMGATGTLSTGPYSPGNIGATSASSGKGLLILAALGAAYFFLRKKLR